MTIQMFQEMIKEAPFLNEDTTMPPPRKLMRRGSLELEDAVRVGDVKLSLPKQDWQSWVASPDWNSRDQDVRDAIDQELSPNLFSTARSDQTSNAGEVTRSRADPVDGGRSPTDESAKSTTLDRSTRHSNEADHSLRADQNIQNSTRGQDCGLPRFSDIIGHNAVKLRLDEVLLPLALPPALADSILVGVRSLSASILLFGPPGCGKTQLANAIAGEAEAAFLSVGPSDILSKFVGESEASIRALFDKAYEQAHRLESKCAVLFFDEIDAIGQSRGSSENSQASSNTDPSSRRVLAELLIQLNRINATHGRSHDSARVAANTDEKSACSSIEENFESQNEDSFMASTLDRSKARIIVVAATNRPEDCDPALLRRFALRVMVNLPSRRDRKKILKRYLTNIYNTVSSAQLDALSIDTEGWTGSDLESLTREAAMAPVRECIRSAALMKRRNARLEQRGGASTSQAWSSTDRGSDGDDSQEKILEQFENLRPVSVQDFEDAIAFWSYNQGIADPAATSEAGTLGTFNGQMIHYDSSSDEED